MLFAALCISSFIAGAGEAQEEGPFPTGRPTYAQAATSLLPLYASSGRDVSRRSYTDAGLPFLGEYLFYAGEEPGDFMVQEVRVDEPGRYQVALWAPRGPEGGRYVVVVDGERIGEEQDAYAEEPQGPQVIDIGEVDLDAGSHRIKLLLTGRDAASDGHGLYVDAYIVRPKPEGEFIRSFQVAGPFTGDAAAAVTAPEDAQWKMADAENGLLDLTKAVGPVENAVAFVRVVMIAPADQDGLLWLGSDDGVTVWLNGEKVHENSVERPALPDQDLVHVRYREGENQLLIRVTNVKGLWGLYVRPHDPKKELIQTSEAREAMRELGERVRGFIVWESNRTGQWELYRINTDGSGFRQLTRLAENNPLPFQGYLRPRVSPDGTIVMFAYGRAKGPVQVWIVPATGGEARKLTEGNPLNWSPDGREIYFVRDSTLWRYNMAEGREAQIQATRLPVTGRDPGTVGAVSADFHTAVFRSARQNEYFLLDRQKTTKTMGGCEIRLTQDGRYVYWVQGPKHFRVWDPAANKEWEFFGEPPVERWNYTYFPTVSADNRWLAYGASPNQHNHDTSDYEIFLQELNDWKPVGKPVRFSFDPHTDRWPFLHIEP